MHEREFKVQAKVNDEKVERAVTADIPENLNELIDRFGEIETVNLALTTLTARYQSVIRANAGKTDDEIRSALAAWEPRQPAAPKKSVREKYLAWYNGLTPEEKAAEMKALRAEAASMAQG